MQRGSRGPHIGTFWNPPLIALSKTVEGVLLDFYQKFTVDYGYQEEKYLSRKEWNCENYPLFCQLESNGVNSEKRFIFEILD